MDLAISLKSISAYIVNVGGNSIHNCQEISTSNPVGSDHRIVFTSVKLSLRKPKTIPSKRLNWQALRSDETLYLAIDVEIFYRHAKALKVGKIFNIWKVWITEFRQTASRILQWEAWTPALVFGACRVEL